MGKEIEGNKLIAEFMGYEYTPASIPVDYSKVSGWSKRGIKNAPMLDKVMGNDRFPPRRYHLGRTHYDLNFNSSWEWLMPVVEKINKESESPVLHFGNVNCYCELRGKKFVAPTMIEATHMAVVEFIKWYNEQE